MSRSELRKRPTYAAALLLLSLLWAAGSFRSDLLPTSTGATLPSFFAAALPLALLAVFAAAIALFRRSPWPRGKHALSALWIALGLFLAPAWLTHFAQSSVSSLARVALFALVPVFAVVLEPHLDPSAARPPVSLAASLAAVLGMLLVFGLELPSTLAAAAAQGALMLAALLIAAANCHAVHVARVLSPCSLASFTSLAAAAASAMLVASGFLLGHRLPSALHASALLWPALVDLPALALLFWLFSRLSALRMTTRFLLAPLFAALVSALIVAPRISLRAACGLLLIAAASAWLLFAPGESTPAGSPLQITPD